MNQDFINQRHQQLWSEKNKHIQRTVFATLIFAIVAMFNVLLPYKNNYVEKNEITAQIDSLKSIDRHSEDILKEITALSKTLTDVDKIIEKKPWDQKRLDLMNQYARLRNSGDSTPSRQQELADNTVKDITRIVHDQVYNPLADFFKKDSLAVELMPETTRKLYELPAILQNWENENIGEIWYETPDTKSETVNTLTNSLDVHLEELSRYLTIEKDSLLTYKTEIARNIAVLQNQNKVKQKQEKLQEIETRMAEIIPSWLKGLVTVKQLVEYFPLIISILFIYIFITGHALSSHYNIFAQSDPSTYKGSTLIASIWTMTDRGRGTILTFTTYLLLAILLWFFFEQGVSILHYCLDVDPNFNKGLEDYMILAWLVRLAMLGTFIYVFSNFWKNHKA